MIRATWDELVQFGVRLMTAKGVSEADARYIAETAVKTEAFGISTHGVTLFPHLDKMLGTEIDAKAQPRIVREKGASAVIDGNSGLGHLAMRLAVELGATKARTHGVAMIGVRNASWLGALGIHLLPLVEQGFLAQLSAQSSSCGDCAPVGGIDARFSTNPVAYAFPTAGDPMIADISTASISMGKLNQMIRTGEKAKAPIFMDREGNVSNDPNVVRGGGSILFTGGETQGHKGYAMSLWCEALTAAAGGSCNNPKVKSRQSFNLLVIDLDGFAGKEEYEQEMKRFVAHVKSSRVRPGSEGIRLPGERGYRSMREARTLGVVVPDHLVEPLRAVATRNGIPSPV